MASETFLDAAKYYSSDKANVWGLAAGLKASAGAKPVKITLGRVWRLGDDNKLKKVPNTNE